MVLAVKAVFVFLLVAVASVAAMAQDGVSYPSECIRNGQTICARLAAHATGTLTANGYCTQLANNSANDYFIPLRTGPERDAFLTKAAPLGIQVTACCQSPHCQ